MHDTTCHFCGETEFDNRLVRRELEVRHENKLYSLIVPDAPILVCVHCGDETADATYDDAIDRALRKALGVMNPKDIRSRREALSLTQDQLAAITNIAVGTLSRWECGRAIPTRSLDAHLRQVFDQLENPQVAWLSEVIETTSDAPGISPCDSVGNDLPDLGCEQFSMAA